MDSDSAEMGLGKEEDVQKALEPTFNKVKDVGLIENGLK